MRCTSRRTILGLSRILDLFADRHAKALTNELGEVTIELMVGGILPSEWGFPLYRGWSASTREPALSSWHLVEQLINIPHAK